jgi:hypothetical protein
LLGFDKDGEAAPYRRDRVLAGGERWAVEAMEAQRRRD